MKQLSLLAQAPGAIIPRFIRPPRPGVLCAHTGLGRSALYNLVSEGKVPAISVRRPGAKRGVTLIEYDGLIAYLESLRSPPGKVGGGLTAILSPLPSTANRKPTP